MKTKELNEAEAGLKLIEDMRREWLIQYSNPVSSEMKKEALFQLDRIDAYINSYFGKQKWALIQKDL